MAHGPALVLARRYVATPSGGMSTLQLTPTAASDNSSELLTVTASISASLAFGTILAQARHGRRMPWDDDLDLMMDEADLHALVGGLPLVNASKAPWCAEPLKCNFQPQRGEPDWISDPSDRPEGIGHCCS